VYAAYVRMHACVYACKHDSLQITGAGSFSDCLGQYNPYGRKRCRNFQW